ncbi:MAG TPA: M50 family metallopeptidase [Acidimicrobiales bacterium]|jgi:membrane-associated protease RseP (regulator of RpoE activity)
MTDVEETPTPTTPGPSGPRSNESAVVYETSPARILTYAAVGAVAVVLLLRAGWSLGPVRVVAMILGIMLMITIHELGHFLTAKWSGMKVTEFFIGFGPKLWSFTRGETEYGFKPVLAGAYVRIIGMNNLDEVAPEDEARSYRQQSFPKRLIVVLAGPATHFVQASVLVFVLLAFVGAPGGSITDPGADGPWVVDSVTEDSAAAAAHLKPGDKIVAFNHEPVSTWDDMTDKIRSTEVGATVTLTIERDGKRFDATTTIGRRPENIPGPRNGPFLGLGPTTPEETLGVAEALTQAPKQTVEMTGSALAALGHFFSPKGLGSFADTVGQGSGDSSEPSTSANNAPASDTGDENRLISILGLVRIGAETSEDSVGSLLFLFVGVNIFVGLLNLIPLLPFDGGHAAVAIYERIRSRRERPYHADVTKLLPFAYAVVMGIVVLGLTTLYLDIVNPIDL